MLRKLGITLALVLLGGVAYLWNRLGQKPGYLDAKVSYLAADVITPGRVAREAPSKPSPYAGKTRKNGQTLAQLRAAAVAQPKDPAALSCLGVALVERQSLQEGIPYLEKSIQIDPRNGAVFFDLVGAYLESGLTERGVRFLTGILESGRADRASAHAALADLKATTGDPQGALVHAEAAKADAPSSGAIQSLLGSIYLQLRDPRAEDALRLAEKLQNGEAR